MVLAGGAKAILVPNAPQLHLAPRVDAWFAFAVSSCAAVASMGQIKQRIRGRRTITTGGLLCGTTTPLARARLALG